MLLCYVFVQVHLRIYVHVYFLCIVGYAVVLYMFRNAYEYTLHNIKYEKTIVVQNKWNLLLKIFCQAFKHYNSLLNCK
jgi:hypothetical protein